MTMTTAFSTNNLGVTSYPRTGKRGVPQQFPRRLYLMLESEAKLQATSSDHVDIISWSESGKAFQITNPKLFSSDVLPKYFRTSKFSSFQRNLNLYGFTKVRHGPDMDMYGHPSFLRGRQELLGRIQKLTSAAGRTSSGATTTKSRRNSRAVSPSPPRSQPRQRNISFVQKNVGMASSLNGSKFYLSDSSRLEHRSAFDPAPKTAVGCGRLDLLTMAISTLES